MNKEKVINSLTLMYSIIDDISTYGDMAKSDDKLFRRLTEKRIEDLSKSLIETDGYELDFKNLLI